MSFGALAADAVVLVADAFVRSGSSTDPVTIEETLSSAEGSR